MRKHQRQTIALVALLLSSGNALAVSKWEAIAFLCAGFVVGRVASTSMWPAEEFGSAEAAKRNHFLLFSVAKGNKNLAKLCIKFGGNPNCASCKKGSPLYVAKEHDTCANMPSSIGTTYPCESVVDNDSSMYAFVKTLGATKEISPTEVQEKMNAATLAFAGDKKGIYILKR